MRQLPITNQNVLSNDYAACERRHFLRQLQSNNSLIRFYAEHIVIRRILISHCKSIRHKFISLLFLKFA